MMRVASLGHAAFAGVMIDLGVQGLIKGDFTPVWQPVPKSLPAHAALAYLCAFVSLASGLGLFWQRAAAVASRVLLALLASWLVLFRAPQILLTPTAQDAWSGLGETAVVVAGAWILYVWFAGEWDARHVRLAMGESGLRLARALYGLALIPFGVAHFRYLKETAALVPGWLPWHLAWAWVTGLAFIAAGVAVLAGVEARLAALLSALQVGLFTLLVWVPIMASAANEFQRSEFIISAAVTAGAWVVADSYRGMRFRLGRDEATGPGRRRQAEADQRER
jgi:uncharacterized membrane protein